MDLSHPSIIIHHKSLILTRELSTRHDLKDFLALEADF
jgi:hypothetical protein